MDAATATEARTMRMQRKVERLERELREARRKAAADLAAERRRSQYKIARVLNRRRERAGAEPSECMICDDVAGRARRCTGPRACRNVICDGCAGDAHFDRRCLLCRSAGLDGPPVADAKPPECATQ